MKPDEKQTGAWRIVFLLFGFMLINFADKAVVGIAAVPIMQELELSPRQYGLLGSSFFLLFSVSAIATGFIVNRVETRWVLLTMSLIWALSQFPMLGQVGLSTILACRVVLGAGEGPAYPVALHAAYKWFPDRMRTLPTAIIGTGAALGVVLTLPALNLIVVRFSWHWAFGVLGFVGLAWTAAWLAFGGEGSIADATAGSDVAGAPLPYRALLLNPTVVSTWCGQFAAYWASSLLLTWYPAFLVKALGFDQQSIGLLAALPPAAVVVFVLFCGWFSQILLTLGISSRISRGVLGGACVALGGLVLLAGAQLPSAILNIAATTVGIAVPSAIFVVAPAVIAEIVPARQRGGMLAIGNAIATSAGLLAPYVTGNVIEDAETPLIGFEHGFIICGIIMVVGGCIAIAFIRPGRETARWRRDIREAEPQRVSRVRPSP